MGDQRAKRLRMECPICHREFDDGLEDHLLSDHTREELTAQVLAYVEAEEQGTVA